MRSPNPASEIAHSKMLFRTRIAILRGNSFLDGITSCNELNESGWEEKKEIPAWRQRKKEIKATWGLGPEGIQIQ